MVSVSFLKFRKTRNTAVSSAAAVVTSFHSEVAGGFRANTNRCRYEETVGSRQSFGPKAPGARRGRDPGPVFERGLKMEWEGENATMRILNRAGLVVCGIRLPGGFGTPNLCAVLLRLERVPGDKSLMRLEWSTTPGGTYCLLNEVLYLPRRGLWSAIGVETVRDIINPNRGKKCVDSTGLSPWCSWCVAFRRCRDASRSVWKGPGTFVTGKRFR